MADEENVVEALFGNDAGNIPEIAVLFAANGVILTDSQKKLVTQVTASAHNKAFAGTGSASTVSRTDHYHGQSAAINLYWVSNARGDDTNGTGGIGSPYKTVAKAITVGEATGTITTIIIDDDNYTTETISVSVAKTVQIMCLTAAWSYVNWNIKNPTVLGTLQLNNIAVEGTITGAGDLVTEDCVLENFPTSSGARYMFTTNTWTAPSGTWYGNVYDQVGDKWYLSSSLDMNSKQIVNVADPSAAQHADTQAARNAAISTHKAIAAAHHARPIQATENVVGIAEVATQAETDAGADDTRMVTPKKLAAFPGAATTRRYNFFTRMRVGIGAGAATSGQIQDVPCILFTDSNDEEMFLANELIPEVDLSSIDPILRIHWLADLAPTVGKETVRLQLELRYRADGETWDGAYDETLTQDFDLPTGSAYVRGHEDFALDRTKLAASDGISVVVTRVGTHGNDDYDSNFAINQVWLVYSGTGGV